MSFISRADNCLWSSFFCKDSANREQNKINSFIFLPRCSLSYPKIVQGERNAKLNTKFLFYISEPQPKKLSQPPRPLLILMRGTYPPPVPLPTSGVGSTVAYGDFLNYILPHSRLGIVHASMALLSLLIRFSPWQSSSKLGSAHLAYRKNCHLVALSLRYPTIHKVG